MGCKLKIKKSETFCEIAVNDLITSLIPSATKLKTDTDDDIQYLLPNNKKALYSNLMDNLERRKNDLGIEEFQPSFTSLEDVFLR